MVFHYSNTKLGLSFFLLFLILNPSSAQSLHEQIGKLQEKAQVMEGINTDSCKYLLKRAQVLIDQLPQKQNKYHQMQAENDYIYACLYSTETSDYEVADSLCSKAYRSLIEIEAWEKAGWVSVYKSFIHFKFYHNLDSSLFWIQRAIQLGEKVENNMLMLYSYQNLSNLQQAEGKYNAALKDAWTTLSYAEKTGDSSNLTLAYNLLANLYSTLQDYENAEKYMNRAYIYANNDLLDFDRKMYIWRTYARTLKANGKSSEAIDLLETVIKASLTNGNNHENALLAYTEIGNTLIEKGGDISQAKAFFDKSIELSEQTGLKPAYHLISLAQLYSKLNEHQKAIALVEDFLKIHGNWNFDIDFYQDISNVYEKAGQSEKALYYLKNWHNLSDSLRNSDNRVLMARLEKKYQVEKKDRQIADQQLALSESHNKQLTLGIILSVVLLGAVAVIIYLRQKAFREKQLYEIRYKKEQLKTIMSAQEDERTRIARELHDGIGQSLAALKIQLQNQKNSITSNSINRVDTLCREVRSLSHRMVPLILEEKGLEDALKALIDQCFTNSNINAHFVSNANIDLLDKTTQTHLYRIGQELIYNILKHARAQEVGLQLLQNDNRLIMIAEDNGVGFDPSQNSNGIGINNIRSRLEAMDGKIEIQTNNQGTFIRVIIPISIDKTAKTA